MTLARMHLSMRSDFQRNWGTISPDGRRLEGCIAPKFRRKRTAFTDASEPESTHSHCYIEKIWCTIYSKAFFNGKFGSPALPVCLSKPLQKRRGAIRNRAPPPRGTGNRLSRHPRLALSPTRKEGPLLAKEETRAGCFHASRCTSGCRVRH